MLKASLALRKRGLAKKSYFERAAKTALENDDINSAWKIAVYCGNYYS